MSDTKNIRAWAKAHAPRRVLERGDGEGTARVPFPSVGRIEYLRAIKGANVPRRAEEAPIERVPLRGIIAIQSVVSAKRLDEHLSNPNVYAPGARTERTGMLVDLPIVVRVGGKLMLHDGHHRATAALLLGEKSLLARVVDLDAEGWVIANRD